MILAIPAALMALLATATLAMRLAVPRLRTVVAAETILLGTAVESLYRATEGLEYSHAPHSGLVFSVPKSEVLILLSSFIVSGTLLKSFSTGYLLSAYAYEGLLSPS